MLLKIKITFITLFLIVPAALATIIYVVPRINGFSHSNDDTVTLHMEWKPTQRKPAQGVFITYIIAIAVHRDQSERSPWTKDITVASGTYIQLWGDQVNGESVKCMIMQGGRVLVQNIRSGAGRASCVAIVR